MSTSVRELHSRVTDGIHVRLLWSERDGGVVVRVADSKTGDDFAVEVRSSDRAMDVFHHPYAYAAWRNVDVRPADGAFALAA
jgi:hypothetical protein